MLPKFFFIIVLGLSNPATCIFYDVLFLQTNRQGIRIILMRVFVWTLLSVLLLAIRCGKDPWYGISAQYHSLMSCLSRTRKSSIDQAQLLSHMAKHYTVSEFLFMLYSGLAICKVRISAKKKLIVFLALECEFREFS